MRTDRNNNQTRQIEVIKDYTMHPDGSVLIKCGNTHVICTAMIEEKVPFFLKGKNSGWISCEYSMLPGSTNVRKVRDSSRGKIDGRSQEIQRLIGRSLRSAIDLDKLGERTIWIDCDVINADGGTRTASINGAFIAMSLAIQKLLKSGKIKKNPIKSKVASISVGIVKGKKLLDLQYSEDSIADVDLNVVMNDSMEIVEIQGTAEGQTFSRSELNELIDLSEIAIKEIFSIQESILRESEKIILSTDNVHKVKEIKNILRDLPIEVLSKSEVLTKHIEVEENLDTLEGNAHLKASAIRNLINGSVIADDTGLFVKALNGAPGVRSARYANSHDDRANRNLLLENLKNSEDRSAYFKTALVYIDENKEEYIFEGICEGKIALEESGDDSFGYDCVFIPKGYDKTFGEISSEEKNKISHRSMALQKFKDFLNKKYN